MTLGVIDNRKMYLLLSAKNMRTGAKTFNMNRFHSTFPRTAYLNIEKGEREKKEKPRRNRFTFFPPPSWCARLSISLKIKIADGIFFCLEKDCLLITLGGRNNVETYGMLAEHIMPC